VEQAVKVLLVDRYAIDWLNLLARWLHVVAAIAWIGTSFYFIAADNHLLAPRDPKDAERGVGGETWEIHGGGFYRIEKYRVAPRTLPEPLHWFKWEAYWTWLSGFALLVVLYYVNARTYLIDPSVADLSPAAAIAISVGLLVAAWVVYDLLCRLSGERDLVVGACLLGLVTLSAWGVSHLFSGRALFIQIGAMLGTIMVGNVFFVIIPAHWELIRAKQAMREPDPAPGLRAKQRSVHNNYLTLPAVVTMFSNHFPFAYARSWNWLILVALLVIGAWVRHFFNLRHLGRTSLLVPATAAVAIAGLAFAIRPSSGPSGNASSGERVPFARVQTIVAERCAACHSANPSSAQFTQAPLGIELDTAAQIRARAEDIDRVAVETKAMPLGNATKMTQAERDLLGAWIEQGAKTD
jgi:uncharacterized membrane protein